MLNMFDAFIMSRREEKTLSRFLEPPYTKRPRSRERAHFILTLENLPGTLKWFEKSLSIKAALANTLHDSSQCWTLRRIDRVSSHSGPPIPTPAELHLSQTYSLPTPPKKTPKNRDTAKKKGSWFWSSAMKHIMLRNVKRAEDYIILTFIYKINNTYWLRLFINH